MRRRVALWSGLALLVLLWMTGVAWLQVVAMCVAFGVGMLIEAGRDLQRPRGRHYRGRAE